MIHLQNIRIADRETLPDTFPFNVPVVQSLQEMTFNSEITFFVGENGSGKSTLLEAIAAAAQLPTVGSESVSQDPSLDAIRQLSRKIRWSWRARTRRGFFMRSEDFFGYVKRVGEEAALMRRELENEERQHKGQSDFAFQLSKMPYARELHGIRSRYGEGLDAQSHGESYFKLFRSRFVPGGLYLLDEPEAPLSPSRQLALLALLREMVKQDAQFIIATHSPIILAYPNATIYSFDNGIIQSVDYDTLEHVTLTRDFLSNPQTYLKHLLG